MVNNGNVKDNLDNVNKNFEEDMRLEALKKALTNKFEDYKKTINYMAADAPIAILNLDKTTQTILVNQGLLRVYDLFDVNFVEIKGLGEIRIRNLTTCLDQFFSML